MADLLMLPKHAAMTLASATMKLAGATLCTPNIRLDKYFRESGILLREDMNKAELAFSDIDLGALAQLRCADGVPNHRDWPDNISPCPVTQLT